MWASARFKRAPMSIFLVLYKGNPDPECAGAHRDPQSTVVRSHEGHAHARLVRYLAIGRPLRWCSLVPSR